jgi:two-component system, response regulator
MNEEPFDILLAEDNLDEAHLTIRTLKKSGYERVKHVRDGEEVLNLLDNEHSHRPKLILLDLKMPKVDGIEVLKALKQDKNWRSIPVVMLTSSTAENDIVTSYDIGVNAYIVKPVSTENFRIAIHDIGVFWLKHNRTNH